MTNHDRIITLLKEHQLDYDDWCYLIATYSPEDVALARRLAYETTTRKFGKNVFFRGIIEFSNICQNDCYYCGIRHSNKQITRYRLSKGKILECCSEGYRLGYRTFVLQSGESRVKNADAILDLIWSIRERFPDCAITLSVGECEKDVYRAMKQAGADRYLLRHETADKSHYEMLHPEDMSFEHRMQCLYDLKELGFQTGCGMMVGTPFQSVGALVKDMEFLQSFQPEMVGIGPFLPQAETPFSHYPAGDQTLTLYLLSLTRLLLPNTMLPATTALGSVAEDGRIQGVLSGCNVVMPNLSPKNIRKEFCLYDNKVGLRCNAEESLQLLKKQMASVGRGLMVGRGDHINFVKSENPYD